MYISGHCPVPLRTSLHLPERPTSTGGQERAASGMPARRAGGRVLQEQLLQIVRPDHRLSGFNPIIVPEPEAIEVLQERLGESASDPVFQDILDGRFQGREALCWLSEHSGKGLLFYGLGRVTDVLEPKRNFWDFRPQNCPPEVLAKYPEAEQLSHNYPEGIAIPDGEPAVCAAENPDIAVWMALVGQPAGRNGELCHRYVPAEVRGTRRFVEGDMRFESTPETLATLFRRAEKCVSARYCYVHVLDRSRFELHRIPPKGWPFGDDYPKGVYELRSHKEAFPLLRIRISMQADLKMNVYPYLFPDNAPIDVARLGTA
jgi:hypothetical protein